MQFYCFTGKRFSGTFPLLYFRDRQLLWYVFENFTKVVCVFLNHGGNLNVICLVPHNCIGGTIWLWKKHHYSTNLPVL